MQTSTGWVGLSDCEDNIPHIGVANVAPGGSSLAPSGDPFVLPPLWRNWGISGEERLTAPNRELMLDEKTPNFESLFVTALIVERAWFATGRVARGEAPPPAGREALAATVVMVRFCLDVEVIEQKEGAATAQRLGSVQLAAHDSLARALRSRAAGGIYHIQERPVFGEDLLLRLERTLRSVIQGLDSLESAGHAALPASLANDLEELCTTLAILHDSTVSRLTLPARKERSSFGVARW